MAYLFTSESVSEGHPDKVSDQISDALLDEFLAFDPQSKVACETLVTTGQVVLAAGGFEGNQAILGFDMGSRPESRRILERARDTGRMIAAQQVAVNGVDPGLRYIA